MDEDIIRVHGQAATVEALQELLERVRSGELKKFPLRLLDKNGQPHDIALGAESAEEEAAMLTAFRKLLGELH